MHKTLAYFSLIQKKDGCGLYVRRLLFQTKTEAWRKRLTRWCRRATRGRTSRRGTSVGRGRSVGASPSSRCRYRKTGYPSSVLDGSSTRTTDSGTAGDPSARARGPVCSTWCLHERRVGYRGSGSSCLLGICPGIASSCCYGRTGLSILVDGRTVANDESDRDKKNLSQNRKIK